MKKNAISLSNSLASFHSKKRLATYSHQSLSWFQFLAQTPDCRPFVCNYILGLMIKIVQSRWNLIVSLLRAREGRILSRDWECSTRWAKYIRSTLWVAMVNQNLATFFHYVTTSDYFGVLETFSPDFIKCHFGAVEIIWKQLDMTFIYILRRLTIMFVLW